MLSIISFVYLKNDRGLMIDPWETLAVMLAIEYDSWCKKNPLMPNFIKGFRYILKTLLISNPSLKEL